MDIWLEMATLLMCIYNTHKLYIVLNLAIELRIISIHCFYK